MYAELNGITSERRYDVRLRQVANDIQPTGDSIGPCGWFSIGNFEHNVRPDADAVIAAMDRLQGSALADVPVMRQEVIKHGQRLWRKTLGVTRGNDSPMAAVNRGLKAAREAGRTPIIWIDGEWRGLPWELMRVPAAYALGLGRDCWLGELAIVAGIVHRSLDELSDIEPTPVLSPEFRISAVFGDMNGNMVGLEGEFARMQSHKNAGLGAVLDPLRGTSRSDIVRHVGTLRNFVDETPPTQFFYLAGHHRTRTEQKKKRTGHTFDLLMRKGVAISNRDLDDASFAFRDCTFAFLNVCAGYSPIAWSDGGLAEYLIHFSKSVSVVASACKLGDVDAERFSQAFLLEILPAPHGLGLPIGEGLFNARKALLQQGTEIGLCYRLFGCHDVVLGAQET